VPFEDRNNPFAGLRRHNVTRPGYPQKRAGESGRTLLPDRPGSAECDQDWACL
jgi:hypothetical protein